MSPHFETKTAKIYQFPLNRRKAPNNPQTSGTPSPTAESKLWPAADFGSGWYHQAAIQDAERPRKP
jgi:hypothetical protein